MGLKDASGFLSTSTHSTTCLLSIGTYLLIAESEVRFRVDFWKRLLFSFKCQLERVVLNVMSVDLELLILDFGSVKEVRRWFSFPSKS